MDFIHRTFLSDTKIAYHTIHYILKVLSDIVIKRHLIHTIYQKYGYSTCGNHKPSTLWRKGENSKARRRRESWKSGLSKIITPNTQFQQHLHSQCLSSLPWCPQNSNSPPLLCVCLCLCMWVGLWTTRFLGTEPVNMLCLHQFKCQYASDSLWHSRLVRGCTVLGVKDERVCMYV